MSGRQQAVRIDAASFVRSLYFAEARRYEQIRQGAPRSNPARNNPRFDGGLTPSGRRIAPVWPRIVQYAAVNRIAPAILIRGVFEAWQNAMTSAAPPQPTQLITSEALTAARQFLRRAISDEENRFTVQDGLFRRESILAVADYDLTPEQAATRVLCDRHQALTALYRYVRATEIGLAEVVGRYREDAIAQYLALYQVYNAAASTRITQEMRDALRDYLEAVNTGDNDV